MPNQKIIANVQVAASIDRQIPGLDPKNIANFAAEYTDDGGVNSEPKSLVIQPGATVTVAFTATKTRLVMTKSDIPLTLEFGTSGLDIPIDPVQVFTGDIIPLGAFKLTNPSTTVAANVEIVAVGE